MQCAREEDKANDQCPALIDAFLDTEEQFQFSTPCHLLLCICVSDQLFSEALGQHLVFSRPRWRLRVREELIPIRIRKPGAGL